MKLIAFVFASLLAARARAAVPALPTAIAEDALKTLKMIAVSNPQNFGFSSQAEVNAAALGPSLREYFVGLADVASVGAGADPMSVMHDGDRTQVVFVEAGGAVRCLILFRYSDRPFNYGGVRRPAGWHAEELGSAAVAKAIDTVIGKLQNGNSDLYLVSIPALGGGLFVVSSMPGPRPSGDAYALWDDDGETGMKAGSSKPLADLFAPTRASDQAGHERARSHQSAALD